MIYFNGYLFKYELIAVVTNMRECESNSVTRYNFTVHIANEKVMFDYRVKEVAEREHEYLRGMIQDRERA